MQNVLSDLDILDFTCVVHAFDAPDLSPEISNSKDLWMSRIPLISSILLANVLCPSGVNYEEALKQASQITHFPDWMLPRSLHPGEFSVLLKHFTALSSIAHSNYDFGLILEDDIFTTSSSSVLLRECISYFIELRADYLDLAGGAGLFVPSLPGHILSLVSPPRTRTNAAYIVSRSFAKLLCNSFFPLCFPIDWHLQFIMSRANTPIRCFWSANNPLIHGSMQNLVKSWRD